jgi:hypothetical protein
VAGHPVAAGYAEAVTIRGLSEKGKVQPLGFSFDGKSRVPPIDLPSQQPRMRESRLGIVRLILVLEEKS